MSAIGLNTTAGLQRALFVRMQAVAARFPLFETKEEGSRRAPTVRHGWLPPKADADAKDFPFILVRPRSGEDSEQGQDENARATMAIVIGSYSDTDDGFMDVQLVIDAIRESLAAFPVLEGTAFEHVGPLRWEIPDEQPRPQWFGVVTTIWNLPRPRRVEG